MPVVTITQENFDDLIKKHDLVFIDFWAPWCKPCLAFAPIFEAAAEIHPDILFGKVNIEEQTELAEDFDVRSIPLLMTLKEQVVVFLESGNMPPSALEELIQQARDIDMTDIKAQIAAAQQQDEDGDS